MRPYEPNDTKDKAVKARKRIKSEAAGTTGQGGLPGVVSTPDDWSIRRQHVVPTDLPISHLECTGAWNELTDSQRHFAHHIGRASWSGSVICANQTSKESPDILRLLLLLLSSTDLQDLKWRSNEAGVTQKEWDYFISYVTCFLTNLGNYLALGDLKIVPGIPEERFNTIVEICPLQGQKKRTLESLWGKTRRGIYSLLPGERKLGIPPYGSSAYYSDDMTSEGIELVSEWMKQAGIEPWNTRIWRKESSGNYGSLPEYDLRIASSLEFPIKTHLFQSKCVIHVVHGDFKEYLSKTVEHLKEALPYADNAIQREIVNCLVKYIETGSVDFHKRSQEIWLDQVQRSSSYLEFDIGMHSRITSNVVSRQPSHCWEYLWDLLCSFIDLPGRWPRC